MQNPYFTERLAAEHQRQLLQEAPTRSSYSQTGSLHIAKEVVVKHIHFVRRTAGVVLAICSTLFGVVVFAPSAFAMVPRDPGGGASAAVLPQPHPRVVHTVVAGGMAGWLITLIAVGAALLAATVAVLMDRARAANRRPTVSAS